MENTSISSSDDQAEDPQSHSDEITFERVTGEQHPTVAAKRIKLSKRARNAATSSLSMPLTHPSIWRELLRTVSKKPTDHLAKPKSQNGSLKRELLQLIEDYQIIDSLHFRSLARTKNHPAQALMKRLVMVKDFEKMIAEACKAYLYTREAPSYKERLESIGSVPESDAEVVTRFADNYDQLFKLQGLDPKKTWKRMYATLIRTNANDGKARCVYLQGAVSAGKSSLINLLSCVYQQYEIGSFGPQAIHSRFWLDNLYGKEIYIGDEAQADESNIQTYLLLLEGNPSNKTEVKYGDKVALEPKPVILACNIDIYDRCPARKEAIRQRITPVRFTRQCPKYLNLRPEPRLLPYVLRTLLERHLDPITDTRTAKIGNYLFIRLRVILYFAVAQHNLNDRCFFTCS